MNNNVEDLSMHLHNLMNAFALVKVFRINPEFRILRLTFNRLSIESQLKNAELGRL